MWYIGTSGWQYRHWRGVFYPDRLPQRNWLEYYAQNFSTVEVNNAFYRLPDRAIFTRWRSQTPDSFVIAVKASRYLTHVRRLNEPIEPVQRLMDRVYGLGRQLGPILLQLPPTLTVEPVLLQSCLAAFPSHTRVTVEPRHSSWWRPDVQQILADHDAALCWADRRSRPATPSWRTAGWAYLRFHQGQSAPRYGEKALQSVVHRIVTTWPPDADVFVYFNNDAEGAAIINARRFSEIARRRGQSVVESLGTGGSTSPQ